METCLPIYLAGNIKKGKEDEHELVWTQEDKDMLQACLPSIKLIFLNPASRSDDLSDQKSVFGRDLLQVFSSSLVLVDARGKRGLGVGSEMMFAKMHRIPVISWLPNNSHYQRDWIQLLGQEIDSWIHPFVFSLSDYLAQDLKQAAKWIEEELLPHNVLIKGPESLYGSIHHYLASQPQDKEMREIIDSSNYFSEKINELNDLAQMHQELASIIS